MRYYMRERQEIIRDFIVAELQKRGLSIKDVANRLGKSQGAVQQVVRSWTSTRIIRNELIKIIKVNPWTKFPPQEYKFED
jgi:lambda repressor-like predicted transcriptional regulator|tara:strand:- start:65 stop:304 length:240 start_codon:yes stop_codon:yes gene_type:complete